MKKFLIIVAVAKRMHYLDESMFDKVDYMLTNSIVYKAMWYDILNSWNNGL